MRRPDHLPEPLWSAAARAEVEVELPGRAITIRPADRRVPRALSADLPLYVITAWPLGERPRPEARHDLAERVGERDVAHWPARARDPGDAAAPPAEGLALRGLDQFRAVAWAASLRQPALFEIADSGLAVIPVPPRRTERPIHYLWVYDPAGDRVEISRDYARPRRDRRGHDELAELVGGSPARVHGKAFVMPFGYRIYGGEDEPVEPAVRDRVAEALVALEVDEGFRLPAR